MRAASATLAALACAACASFGPVGPGLNGKPLSEFFDDLKGELRAVHWRIRSTSAACGTAEPREVDLRNATIALDLQRIGETSVDGQIRLVALPLASAGIAPFGSASSARKWTQEMALKLDVTGPTRLYEVGEAPDAGGAVARSVNAALDGFMRSSAAEPCVRLSSLKLTLIVDVERSAGGGFKLAVPAAQLGVDASRRDVNTLTLTWDKVVSNALR
ncbi:MAG TPA: hypothetical protein VIF33_09730 [Casimicrobiaceae bacterium]|jgi:hypothetical protein